MEEEEPGACEVAQLGSNEVTEFLGEGQDGGLGVWYLRMLECYLLIRGVNALRAVTSYYQSSGLPGQAGGQYFL